LREQGKPNSAWLATSIEQTGTRLTFHNEHGQTAYGSITGSGRLTATEWGNLGASFSQNQINWDNGSV